MGFTLSFMDLLEYLVSFIPWDALHNPLVNPLVIEGSLDYDIPHSLLRKLLCLVLFIGINLILKVHVGGIHP